MKRQLLVGHLGSEDSFEVVGDPDENITYLQLVGSKKKFNFGISEALNDLENMGLFPSEVGIDLLVLAAHIHAADTRISRIEQSQDSWTREIRLVVPVSNISLWSTAQPIIKKILNFLTGDRWIIEFRIRPDQFSTIASVITPSLFVPQFDCVSLFSGGLDSLIGAINLLEDGNIPLLISHFGESATSDAQKKIFQGLKSEFNMPSFERLRVGMTFPEGTVKGVSSEDTTRGRSFLFFALGVLAGTGFKEKFTLYVPENGFISLNVPLDQLRLGSNSTRTTHPYYIARWNDLLKILNLNGEIINPYWNKTKGEMVKTCHNSKVLKTLAPDSLSCSSSTKGRWKGVGIQHCGYCLPCLIRRAALISAWGENGDSTIYTLGDLHARPLNSMCAEGKQIRSFQYAIERLRANPEYAKLLIHKPGSLADVSIYLNDLAEVYRRGLDEVSYLIDGIETKSNC